MKRSLCAGILAASAGLAAAIAPGAGVRAQSIVATGESFVSARLVLGERDAASGVREAGLLLDVKPGWKTYWRSPGEAGVPPRFDWSGSENLAGVEIDWPTPEVFESFGMQTIGYSGEVLLPLRLRPENPEAAMALDLDLALGVCDDICVMQEAELSRRVAPEDAPGEAGMIAEARARVPGDGAAGGLVSATCRITGAGETRGFEATLDFARAPADPVVVLEGPEASWFQGTETRETGESVAVTSTLGLLDGGAWVGREAIRITVLAEDFAADVKGCSAPAG